jgi:hypothetical protein
MKKFLAAIAIAIVMVIGTAGVAYAETPSDVVMSLAVFNQPEGHDLDDTYAAIDADILRLSMSEVSQCQMPLLISTVQMLTVFKMSLDIIGPVATTETESDFLLEYMKPFISEMYNMVPEATLC